jgi:phosphatidate cytidylyltransferase
MLYERIAIALLLIPFGIWVVGAGGWLFTVTITAILCLAAYEYAKLFELHGYRPATLLLVAGTLVLALARHLFAFSLDPVLLAALILLSMTWHALDFERGAPQSGTDFALTVGGIVYVGWMGAYFIALRQLPDGVWWFMTALPVVWLADTAAYSFGKRFGKYKLAPRLSPNKTWEGYLAGIVGGPAVTMLMVLLWRFGAGPDSTITLTRAFIIGLIIATAAPMGDLGISMLKRQFKVKDTGALLPGHGGALDRIDSWVWAAVLGYHLVVWMT